MASIVSGAPDGIVLPKVYSAVDVNTLGHYLSALEVREKMVHSSIKIMCVATETAASLLTFKTYLDGVDGRFFGRLFGPWTTWLKSRSLGDEFEPLRDVVRRHVFDHFSVRRGVLVLGVPSEGKAAVNARKPFPLKGFAKRNAEGLVRRGLAKRQADGSIVPMGFVTQRMLEAYERERKVFSARKGSGAKVEVAGASAAGRARLPGTKVGVMEARALDLALEPAMRRGTPTRTMMPPAPRALKATVSRRSARRA